MEVYITRARIRRKRRRRLILAVAALVGLFIGLYLLRHRGGGAAARDAPEPSEEPIISTEPETSPALTPTPSPTPSSTPEPTPEPSPTPEPEHEHTWGEVYTVEHIPASGHWVTVTVEDAWDEPQTGSGFICGACGAGFLDAGSAAAHIGSAHNHVGSYYQGTVTAGSIHHDAVTEQRWVVDVPEHDESILTGYRCEGCGAEMTVQEYQENAMTT